MKPSNVAFEVSGSSGTQWVQAAEGSDGSWSSKCYASQFGVLSNWNVTVWATIDGYTSSLWDCWIEFPSYVGHQNPWPYYQMSNKSVNIPNLGNGIFGYRTPSKIPYNATRNDCINAMITTAISYVGTTSYVWDYSCAPGVGVDCSGLVMQCLYAVGMDLSPMNPWDHYFTPGHDHYANDMRSNPRFMHVSFDQRQVGDLIMTNGHVSIYVGGDRIIEAYSSRVGVRYASVYSSTPILAVLRPIV